MVLVTCNAPARGVVKSARVAVGITIQQSHMRKGAVHVTA